jgi:hypothetical protein
MNSNCHAVTRTHSNIVHCLSSLSRGDTRILIYVLLRKYIYIRKNREDARDTACRCHVTGLDHGITASIDDADRRRDEADRPGAERLPGFCLIALENSRVLPGPSPLRIARAREASSVTNCYNFLPL